jgi:hypothetical protein
MLNKSKTMFETLFCALIKFAEQAKIHLPYVCICGEKVLFRKNNFSWIHVISPCFRRAALTFLQVFNELLLRVAQSGNESVNELNNLFRVEFGSVVWTDINNFEDRSNL